ncbi:thioesterase [Lentzea sp. NBRC 105346]|uniref:thioesterase II family protein n=1 Tax=Lentzea sp. NBRC 105346 TaxID=3032205 RepID=UPI0024A54389|nr:thioesterase domain-containing protein [Lentzea sp. NBRC 105346]GLZ35171.1 thioesterase [Lentzea sp. NBRC 105346]
MGRWLLLEPDPDATKRLFCFPFAGVGAAAFRGWPGRIGDIEICPVQLPGRENRMRDAAYTDFDTFGTEAASALEPYLDRPFAFFGHCMGALLAHAVADRLERKPNRLFVSSSYVPYLGISKPFHPSMTDEQLVDELRAIAIRLGDPDPLPELLELSVGVLRNDIDMAFEYAPPARPLHCPITTVGWADDTIVPHSHMGEWKEYGDVTHHVLKGDFFDFLGAPAELRDVIARDFKE